MPLAMAVCVRRGAAAWVSPAVKRNARTMSVTTVVWSAKCRVATGISAPAAPATTTGHHGPSATAVSPAKRSTATAAFLVKPDMGPLFSRVVNRVAGTAVGVLLFAGLTAVAEGPLWPVVVAEAAGALILVA
ncbi:FUSC family protein, partial [Streptomyces daliensis]|nr:FUSC family protein [Streptomyces daliensis]